MNDRERRLKLQFSIRSSLILVAVTAILICVYSGVTQMAISRRAARGIEIGMSKKEVSRRIGEPHDFLTTDGETAELYRVWGLSDMLWLWYSDDDLVEDIH